MEVNPLYFSKFMYSNLTQNDFSKISQVSMYSQHMSAGLWVSDNIGNLIIKGLSSQQRRADLRVSEK